MPVQMPELRRGDLMLEEAAGLKAKEMAERAIVLSQAITSFGQRAGDTNIMHAAIWLGGGILGEATPDEGIRLHPPDAGYTYRVWRYQDEELRRLAAAVAEGYIKIKQNIDSARPYNYAEEDFGTYTVMGCVVSLLGGSVGPDRAMAAGQQLWEPSGGQQRAFFCSNFVVRCFHAAGVAQSPPKVVVNLDHRYTCPQELEGTLRVSSGWKFIGNFVG